MPVNLFFLRSSRGCLSKPPSVQLQEIVGQTDQLPFSLNAVETAEKELPEASHRLDPSEDWFNGSFSFRVSLLPLLGSQEPFHPFLDRDASGFSHEEGRGGFRVGVSRVSGRDERMYASYLCMGDVVFTVVTCV
jgi:hypothetical protein